MPHDALPSNPTAPPGQTPATAGPILVTVKPRGTILVHGSVVVQDLDGNVIPQPTFKQPGVVKFCGCGRSGNKPFCDGSHKKGNGEPGTGNG